MSLRDIFSIIILFFNLLGFSQNDKNIISESQVNLEEAFANAQKEALVGKPDKAIELFEALYKENRTDAAIAMELAKLYNRKKDHALVDKYAKIAIENSTTNIWILEFYADYLLTNNRAEDASIYYTKLKTLNPSNTKYYQNLVDCYLLLNKKKEAISVYNEMEAKIGNIEEVYLSRFELYESLNNPTAALAQIDYLIKNNPRHIQYVKAKARYLTRQNKLDEAVLLYKEVLKISPEDTDANLAILSKGSDNEKPNAYLMSLLPLISNPSINIDAKIKELLPYLNNMSKGNNLELINSMKELGEKLVLAHPDEAKAYSMYGDVLYISGDVDNAIQKYEKTILLNSKVFTVWEQLMYAYLDNADYESLLKRSTKSLDIFPNQAMSYFFNSIANTMKNNPDEAIMIAEEGKIVSGGNIVLLSQINTALAQAYLGKKDIGKATVAISEALKLSNNNNAYALEIQGDILRVTNDDAKALDLYMNLKSKGNSSRRLNQKLQLLKGN